MLRRAIAALLAMLPLAGGEGERLSLLSFNVLRPEWGRSTDPAWAQRRTAAAAVLAATRPDLVGLQEESQPQLDDLLAADPGLQLAGARPLIGGSILYRRTRFQLVHFGMLAVPERLTAFGGRAVQWALLRSAATGVRILLVNAHLTPFEEEARLQGVELLLRFLAEAPWPRDVVLIVGDLNSRECSPPYRRLLAEPQLRLRSAWRWQHGFRDDQRTASLVEAAWDGHRRLAAAAKDGTAIADAEQRSIAEAIAAAGQGSFHGFQPQALPGQIDHILVPADVDIAEARFLTAATDGVLPSDHYPLHAEIILPVHRQAR